MLLSGCKNDGTATVIYTDVPPPLTKMSYEESLPPETYSQYMETYTHTSETESLGYFQSLKAAAGINADTGITAPSADGTDTSPEADRENSQSTTRSPLIHDTAVSMPTRVTADNADSIGTSTETSVPTETSPPAGTEETVTCAPLPPPEETVSSSETKVTLSRPKADTIHSGSISADTAPTRFESTDTSSEASD